MDMSQMKFDRRTTRTSRRTTGVDASAANGDRRRGGPQIRAAAATARQALLGLASTKLGVPVASLTVEQGRRLGRRQVGHLRRSCIGDKLFNVRSRLRPTARDARRPGAGLAGRSRSAQYKLVGTSAAADRHPGEGHRASTPTSTTSASRACCTAASCGRAARARTATARSRRSLSVDESSIKHIPGVQVVRSGDFLGVVAPTEYDAIQAAAQLKVKWADPPALAGQREPLEADARPRQRRARRRPRIALNSGNVDAAFAVGRAQVVRDLHVPLQRPHADRPDAARRRRDAGRRARVHEHAGRLRARARTSGRRSTSCWARSRRRSTSIRVTYYEGARALRLGAVPRRRPGGGGHVAARRASRCGCSSCAGTSTAGTTTARRS